MKKGDDMLKRNMICAAAVAGSVLGACGCAVQQNAISVPERDPSRPVLIQVDPGKSPGAVNPLIFGNNLEAANGKDIFSSKVDTAEPTNGQGSWNPGLRRPVPEVVEICKSVRMGMLRYPGGCLTHNFDWHQAVGPASERKYFKFGIDEYIELCRAIGAEPLMNVSEICSPKDTADLVEYLNLPAVPEYPWAMKRAQWGHKEPYKVKYFEMANESDHGNHNVQPLLKRNATEYAGWYLSCAEAMRSKDRSILVGGHAGTGTPVSDPWNHTLLKLAGGKMDFLAVHTYAVSGTSDDTSIPMRACMASTDQMEAKLADYRALSRKAAGKEIPLAVTEFNASFIQEKPVPYRFTFGAALFCADYMRVMLKPENNVAFANYWQFLNGYWGYLRTKTENGQTQISTRAPYPVFKLLGEHTDTALLDCRVSNEPRLEFEGFVRAMPAKKNFHAEKVFIRNMDFPLADDSSRPYKIRAKGRNSMEIIFSEFTGESYFEFKDFPVKPGLSYQVSFELKSTPEKGSISPGLGLCDARGWTASKSACGVEGSGDDLDWKSYESSMMILPDAKALYLVLRIRQAQKFSGRIEMRNIRIAEIEPESFPPYSAITAFATGTSDRKVVKLIVMNKHHADDLPAHVSLKNIRSAKIWTVSAPDLAVISNSPDGAFERVSGEPVEGISAEGFTRTFPARSISAVEIVLD
ncbi:MAG TPA: hypothetical protein DET40_17985 [Lentisphaeria bacterium]|nr:MAG: hypothetical protein A2X45_02030 [Lentisphaerae bacterium GWF2_50_93]HCE45433.1 hypothetical protein [Lentisphaeria bacterium]